MLKKNKAPASSLITKMGEVYLDDVPLIIICIGQYIEVILVVCHIVTRLLTMLSGNLVTLSGGTGRF